MKKYETGVQLSAKVIDYLFLRKKTSSPEIIRVFEVLTKTTNKNTLTIIDNVVQKADTNFIKLLSIIRKILYINFEAMNQEELPTITKKIFDIIAQKRIDIGENIIQKLDQEIVLKKRLQREINPFLYNQIR